jgi:uncharacterized DUF497 family protein
MQITFDPAKRDRALAERGLDFMDAEIVFQGVTLEVEDIRKAYGEQRTANSELSVLVFWLGAWSLLGTHRVVRTATSLA